MSHEMRWSYGPGIESAPKRWELAKNRPINLLKTKLMFVIEGISAYRAVYTLQIGYNNQSLYVL
jgi:hypothetical protein